MNNAGQDSEGRKNQKSQTGKAYADGSDFSSSKLPGQQITGKAGNNGSGGDDHGDDSGPGDRSSQFQVHTGPGGSQKSIGKSQTDKRKINDNK